MRVNGNISGIKDAHINTLEKLYDVSIQTMELVSIEILDILTAITSEINKEISIFINRRGKVIDVSIGDHSTVSLPTFDFRRGNRRLSGIRCIHTHPEGSSKLSAVDVSALINLRLDLIAAVGVKDTKVKEIYIGHLVPQSGALSENYNLLGPYYRDNIMNLNVFSIVKEIERNIDTNVPEETEKDRREKVLLVGLSTQDGQGSSEDLLHELEELSEASGAQVVGKVLQKRDRIDTGYYIGRGKAQELNLLCQAYDVDTLVFDDELSGAQVRNLEEATGVKVIDRTTLILDIFAKRAMTREGKLQVELAQLKYRLPRLIGLGKVLSRTGGGIGTRGPGEKKLETDRRHIRERINELESALQDVKKNRGIQRGKRKSSSIPVVSLVGYTNSGKSTLRNRLSRMYSPEPSIKKEDVLEADMLFATLDPTTRVIKLPKGREILLSDTVGFIRKLPHDLIDAFRATLEEAAYSDMLIHVVDGSAPNVCEQIKAVNTVLSQINAIDKPIIIAINKIDKVKDSDILALLRKDLQNTVDISALYGYGIDNLISLVESKLFSNLSTVKFKIPYDKMSIKSSIYKESRVIEEDYDENSVLLTAEVNDDVLSKYRNYLIGNN